MKNLWRQCLLILIIMMISTFALAKKKDTVFISVESLPTSLNSLGMRNGTDWMLAFAINQSLMSPNPKTGELETLLAESVEVMENQADIKVTLKKGIRFHTGEPLTTHDVLFSYNMAQDPSTGSLGVYLDEIDEIELVDDYTLIFHFYEPYAVWREVFATYAIHSKAYLEKAGKNAFFNHPRGAGAFQFESYKKGESITLKRFDLLPGNKLPQFSKLVFKIVPDPLTRIAMLKTGDVDLVIGISPFNLRELKNDKNFRVKSDSTYPSYVRASFYSVNYPVLNLKLKTALNLAVNRQEIVDKLYMGQGYPLYILTGTADIGYNPDLKYEYNPEKARKLVKESGYKPGTEIMFTYTEEIAEISASLLAQLFARYMKEIGVKIVIRQLDSGVLTTYERNKDKKTGHMSLAQGLFGRDPNLRLILAFKSDSPFSNGSPGVYQDRLDKLIDEQAHEMDYEKRKKLIREIWKVNFENPRAVPLLGHKLIYAMTKAIDYTWTPYSQYGLHLDKISISDNP